jgi:rhodanese-related sulfurtransferase
MSKSLLDFIEEAKSKITEVDVNQAQKMINEGYKILDVRESGEHLSDAIKGSLNIPRGILEAAADLQYPGANPAIRDARDDKWLILCRTSGRSAMATVVLQEMGFSDVVNIAGGMLAWKESGLDTISQTI